MRGNKRLVQGIAVATMTGALVLTALPQQMIIKTEETVQITQNTSAGTSAMSDGYMSQIFTQAMNLEKSDASPVMSTAVVGKPFIEKPAVIEHADTEKKETVKKTNGTKKNTEKKSEKQTAKKTSETSKKDQENSDASDQTDKSAQKTDSQGSKDSEDRKNKTDNKNKIDRKSSNEVNAGKVKNTKASDPDKADSKKKNKVNNQKDEKDEKSSVKEKWEDKLMADVDKSLNIRKSDDIDSEVLGKLRKGDTATVLKKGKKWTKIKSGDVIGYVKNSYCVYGTDAYKLAKKICHTYATVKADGLRIRQKAHDNAIVLRAAEEGDKLVVNKDKKEKDGWVAVTVDDTKGYVSSDYVDVALGTGKAISIEEELAQIAAQQKAEAAKQAASSSASNNTANSSVAPAASTAAQVSTNDLTLLSAIIFCEAGGESYAGQVAVGAVVMNRLKSGSFPNTISGVVYQSGQFSPVANGALARALANGNYTNCTSAAQAALAGSDNTGGAKFFHRVNGDAGLVIGNHVFY